MIGVAYLQHCISYDTLLLKRYISVTLKIHMMCSHYVHCCINVTQSIVNVYKDIDIINGQTLRNDGLTGLPPV